ncbi:hypothetical protein D3C86_1940310 [compost metagenome]
MHRAQPFTRGVPFSTGHLGIALNFSQQKTALRSLKLRVVQDRHGQNIGGDTLPRQSNRGRQKPVIVIENQYEALALTSQDFGKLGTLQINGRPSGTAQAAEGHGIHHLLR